MIIQGAKNQPEMPYNPTEFTRFTVSEVTALNDIGEQEHLPGFPMADAMLYADDRWLTGKSGYRLRVGDSMRPTSGRRR
jgi:hypothetical protein